MFRPMCTNLSKLTITKLLLRRNPVAVFTHFGAPLVMLLANRFTS